MDRVLAIVALALTAGCSSSGPVRFVGGEAVLSAVSSDQKYVAVLGNAMRLATGAHIGQLEAVPTSGMVPTALDPSGYGGVYNRGANLWYLGTKDQAAGFTTPLTVVDEGTPAVTHVYGQLYVWNDTFAWPIKIGDNVRDFAVSQNGSTVGFMDWAARNDDATNTGTLSVVTISSCDGMQCEKVAVAAGVTAAQASWRLSSDGKYVLAALRGAAATDAGRVVLLQPATGTMRVLSTGVNPRSPMMQPTGETAAWLEGANELHVVPPAMPTPEMTTVLTVSSPVVDSASMVDGATFVVKTRDSAAGTPSLQRLTAAGATPLSLGARPLDYFVSQAVPGQTDKFVFFSTATSPATGDHDLWMLDMSSPSAQPVALANAVDSPIAGAVGFSDDGTMIEFFDNFDPVTRRGDELIAPLPTGTRTLVALALHNAAFLPDSTRLLYIAAPDPTSGAGVLTLLPSATAATEVEDVGIVNFADPRNGPERTWYTKQSGGSDDGVYYVGRP